MAREKKQKNLAIEVEENVVEPNSFSFTEAVARSFSDKNIIKDTDLLESKYRRITPSSFFSYKSRILSYSTSSPVGSKVLPVLWDSAIIPKMYEERISSFSDEDETLMAYLKDSETREIVTEYFSNPEKLKKIIAASVGSNNGQVHLGGLITSTLGIYYATANEIRSSAMAKRCVAMLLYRAYKIIGLTVQLNEWINVENKEVAVTQEEGISALITDYRAKVCVRSLPFRDIIDKEIVRTTCFEMANAICLAHVHFLNELRNFHDFEISLNNVLIRLKHYLRGEATEVLGEAAYDILSSSESFKKLSMNLTMIMLALEKPGGTVDTDIARWEVENERVASAIFSESKLFEIVGPDDVIKKLDFDVIFSTGPNSRKVCIVSKSFATKETFRGFRVSRVNDERGTLTRDVYFRDERLNILSPAVDFFMNLDIKKFFVSHLTAMVSYHDTPVILYNGLSDYEIILTAMALNRRVYLDVDNNKMLYSITKNMTDDGSRALVNIIGEEGFTTDAHTSIFITAPIEKKATSPWVTFEDMTNFASNQYYSGANVYVFDPFSGREFEQGRFTIMDKDDPSKNHKIYIDVNLQDSIVSSKVGKYVITLNRKATKNFYDFALYYNIMNRLNGKGSPYQKYVGWSITLDEICKNIIRPLYDRSGAFEYIVRNRLWTVANKDKLIADSIFIDYQLKLDVKVVAVQLMLAYAGFDITDVKEFIDDNKHNVLRGLINVN